MTGFISEANASILISFQHIKGLGKARIAARLRDFDSPQSFLQHISSASNPLRLSGDVLNELRMLNHRKPYGLTYDRACADLALCKTKSWQVLSCFDDDYPIALLQLAKPPPLLYLSGARHLLARSCVAIVGSRRASASGLQIAQDLAKQLSSEGHCVVSGLATGIDTASHKGALQAGGKTIAVIGTGLDRCYPAQNRALATCIEKDGLIVSEFPLGSAPLRGNFPQRNRIISGLSTGVVVVEAAKRSGSLITAKFALEQNREVFAVPGSINDRNSDGCNELIQQGAKLVLSANDIFEELNYPLLGQSPSDISQEAQLTAALAQVLEAVSWTPTPVDLVCDRCTLAASEVMAALVELELAGLISQNGIVYQRLS